MKRALALSVLLSTTALSEPAMAQAPTWAPEQDKGWYADQRGFVFKLDVGGAYRRLYEVNFGGGVTTLTLGGLSPAGGFMAALSVLTGESDQGLGTRQLVHSFRWQMPPVPDVHLGAGFRTSYFAIQRASADDLLEAVGLGGEVFGAYDFYRTTHVALSVDASVVVDVLEGPPLYGATLGVGASFF